VKLKDALGAVASVVFPAPCRICGLALTNASRIPICEDCLSSFEPVAEPMCVCCGRPFASGVAAQAAKPLCRLCRLQYYGFDGARSFAIYDDALFEAIVLLKYEQVSRLGNWFAGKLAEVARLQAAEWRANVVVSVPLHAERRRERGYNQAELIARPLARRLGLRFESRLLARVKPRPPQLVLSRSERWQAVRGAYAAHDRAGIENLRVLLIDDVMTTGATLDACARVLKKAGAEAVFGLTVGRARSGNMAAGAKVSLSRAIPNRPVKHLTSAASINARAVQSEAAESQYEDTANG
jgi:ComF family protein